MLCLGVSAYKLYALLRLCPCLRVSVCVRLYPARAECIQLSGNRLSNGCLGDRLCRKLSSVYVHGREWRVRYILYRLTMARQRVIVR